MPRSRARTPGEPSRAITVAPTPAFADPTRREKLATAFPAIRSTLFEFAESQHIPGLAFGVVVDGELACSDTFGERNVESNIPVTHETVFRIASMSKSFVAMSILRLRDEKKLRLDDPVSKHVPELKTLSYPTHDSPALTLRHLLNMSPGFPEDNPWGDRQMAIGGREFTKRLKLGIPFSTSPNTAFEYSNLAYSILGRVITRVAGVRFQEYVRRHILKPLRMNSTEWDLSRVPGDHLAQGYRWEDNVFKPQPILKDGAFAAMAGLWTTISDFAKYISFLLDAFPPRDDRERGPVSRATAREMQQLSRFESLVEWSTSPDSSWQAAVGYGFGLAVAHDARIGHIVSHSGGLPGYSSYFQILPDYGVGVVALTNRTYARVGMIFPTILEHLRSSGGLVPRSINPSPVLAAMHQVVQRWIEGAGDSELAACAADNLLMDQDSEHRRAIVEDARAQVGAFKLVGEIQPLNALRGRWRIDAERGWLEVRVTLAPTMPPRIQHVSITPHLHP